jgi:hypothetical protein
VAAFLASYPDLTIDVGDLIAEGDKAAIRVRWRGTDARNGEAYHVAGVVFLRLNRAGQIAERWSGYARPDGDEEPRLGSPRSEPSLPSHPRVRPVESGDRGELGRRVAPEADLARQPVQE